MQLIIPAFNEQERLPRTLAALRRHVLGANELGETLEVIVVDNASTDDTEILARAESSPAMPVRVVRCETRGKGAAVRAGVAATSSDLVGFMDADCATDLAALAEGMRLIRGGADMAIGSRAVDGSVTMARHSWLRARGATCYRSLTQRVTPGIVDTQCGFKLIRGELARDVLARTRCAGFSFDVEMLGLAQRAGAVIVEFPVVWTDVAGSTFVPARHGGAAFWELAQIAARLRRERRIASVSTIEAAPSLALPVVASPAVDG
jgi:glycosyltransferase involved in cell wall biosynthesis